VEITYNKEPFDHWVIDNFLEYDHAKALAKEFTNYHDNEWYVYNNPLEVKKTLNNWWKFPPATYSFMEYLNSDAMISYIENLTGTGGLYPDLGLHGAGWHIHSNGGKLNVHLDYSVHPKLNLQRKYNLIYYLSEDWDTSWGGNLEFWSGNSKKATSFSKQVDCVFNRAVIFDTTQNSWHGFPKKINCPDDQYRKSIAMYYLTEPDEYADSTRKRALYSPSKEQENDVEIIKLINERVKSA